MITKVHDIVTADCRPKSREVAVKQCISFGSRKGILTKNLGQRRLSAKFVPGLLTAGQNGHHLAVASDFLERSETDKHFSENIVILPQN